MTNKNQKVNNGARFGDWTLQDKLGSGGNGEVWRATSSNQGEAAIKILYRAADERRKRFSDEIEFLTSYRNQPGILPILDSVPTQASTMWYAMPLATPLDKIILGISLEDKVRIVRSLAEALGVLHGHQVFHRDIKPDNLFWYKEGAVFGDFGLVDFPTKESLTGPSEKIGPTFFIAPELLLRQNAEQDFSKSDVFSLAKTLWVFASEQRYPPPGQVSLEPGFTHLETYTKHDRLDLLQWIVHNATANDFRKRPTCEEFAKQLNNWLEDLKITNFDESGVRNMRLEFSAEADKKRQASELSLERRKFLVETTLPTLKKSLQTLRKYLFDKSGLRYIDQSHEQRLSSLLPSLNPMHEGVRLSCIGMFVLNKSQPLRYYIGYIASCKEPGKVKLSAIICFLAGYDFSAKQHFEKHIDLCFSSDSFAADLESLHEGLKEQLQSSLDAFLELARTRD